MTLTQTSRAAYAETVKKRGSWELAVLGVIVKYGPISDRAVAARLDKECAFISARRNSLVKQGKVFPVAESTDPLTHHKIQLWGAMYQ